MPCGGLPTVREYDEASIYMHTYPVPSLMRSRARQVQCFNLMLIYLVGRRNKSDIVLYDACNDDRSRTRRATPGVVVVVDKESASQVQVQAQTPERAS